MGSDLYISIDTQNPNGTWSPLWEGPSTELARGVVVDAFGTAADSSRPDAEALGYLPQDQWEPAFSDAPWIRDEPYWIRRLNGHQFCEIVRDKHWQRIQKAPDGSYDFADKECQPELRAFASLVQSLLNEGHAVRVWCWHSQ